MIIGINIRDIEEISSFEMSSTYEMLVSERDIYVHDRFNSRKLDLETLERHSDIYVGTEVKNNFGSMAYVEISSFSPNGHNHVMISSDSVSSISSYTYSNVYSIELCCTRENPNAVKMGTVFLNGRMTDIYFDKTKNGDPGDIPLESISVQIGTFLPYLTTNPYDHKSYIDIMDSQFDGWVYANNYKYSLSDFTMSDQLSLQLSAVNGKFNVPDISCQQLQRCHIGYMIYVGNSKWSE